MDYYLILSVSCGLMATCLIVSIRDSSKRASENAKNTHLLTKLMNRISGVESYVKEALNKKEQTLVDDALHWKGAAMRLDEDLEAVTENNAILAKKLKSMTDKVHRVLDHYDSKNIIISVHHDQRTQRGETASDARQSIEDLMRIFSV